MRKRNTSYTYSKQVNEANTMQRSILQQSNVYIGEARERLKVKASLIEAIEKEKQ